MMMFKSRICGRKKLQTTGARELFIDWGGQNHEGHISRSPQICYK